MNNQKPTKVCSKCQEEKTLREFHKRKDSKDGHFTVCKICRQKKNKQYDLKHKKEKKIRMQQWYKNNKNKIKLYSQQHYLDHKNEIKIRLQRYYFKNKEKIDLKHKKYNDTHEKERRKRENNKRKIDPIFKIKKILRCRMNVALRAQGVKKSQKTFDCLGCTVLEFQFHIQSIFKPGMTLANNGKRKWQLHHKRLLSSFDLSNLKQQKKAFHYTNVVPMWEDEHKALHSQDFIK